MGKNKQKWLKNLYFVSLGSLTPIRVHVNAHGAFIQHSMVPQ